MSETPRREFNLPHSGLSSRERGLVVEDAALAWAGREGPRRRAFDDIARIKMEAELDGDNPFAKCEIFFRDETKLRVEVTNDALHYDDSLEYRAFLAAFFEQLGPERRARLDFIYGPSDLKRTIQIAVSAAFVAAFVGLIIFGSFSSDLWKENNWLLIPLSLLMGSLCAGMLYASIKNRQKPFEPLAIPEMLLPMLKAPKGSGCPTSGGNSEETAKELPKAERAPRFQGALLSQISRDISAVIDASQGMYSPKVRRR